MTDPMMEKFIQHTHLTKLYGYLPGMAASQPAIFGIDPDDYARCDRQSSSSPKIVARAFRLWPVTWTEWRRVAARSAVG